MPKANKPAAQTQKTGPDTTKGKAKTSPTPVPAPAPVKGKVKTPPVQASETAKGKGKTAPVPAPAPVTPVVEVKGQKARPARYGGTAIQGAKSTQPKEVTSTNPQQQEYESYNRETRRRMQHLKTGPYSETTISSPRKKRLERRQRKLEETREEVRRLRSSGPGRITLGRRNTYFLIGVGLLVLLVILFAVLHQLRVF